jgi:hypothetical protein
MNNKDIYSAFTWSKQKVNQLNQRPWTRMTHDPQPPEEVKEHGSVLVRGLLEQRIYEECYWILP